MTEALRKRPSGSAVLHRSKGHIRARPKAVFEALDARFHPGDGSHSQYFADPGAFLIVAQGGWWYRGEYRVVPDETGSHLEHSILTVAAHSKVPGRFTGRRVITQAPGVFDDLLRQLRRELE